ncbi:UNVERIFIED_CONTAM: hypothetical protein Sangu_0931600 [Sesamum angustifolium]|uniref:Uncharacterized protein n=1 Tax=Sesamum angustifolium TaxID=2727405 RepID=A0AAW2PCX3_9LAMI
MGSSNVPIPVFVETNLGTRLAVPVSPDITVKELKRELERAHLSCFPEFGSIWVNALMVQRESHCYHLSESLPLKFAFLGSNVVCLLKRKTKRKNVKRKHKVGCPGQGPSQQKARLGQFASIAEVNWSKRCDSDVVAEALSETFSESVSVSGIIKKYFSDYDEVASSSGFPFTTVRNRHKERLNNRADCKTLNIRSGIMSPVTCHIPPRVSQDVWLEKCSSEASREKLREPEVGKRLLLASDSLGLNPSKRQPVLSLCRDSDGKSPFHNSAAIVQKLVFELTDDSD